MRDPAITVWVSTRNARCFIARCLDSLITQTFTDWEAIVIDDASTDGTQEQMLAHTWNDDRIRVILNATRQRQVGCFLQAFPQMRGAVIAELDGDDWFCSAEALAEIKAAYDADDQCDATSGRNRSTLGFESTQWIGETRPSRWGDLSASMCAPRTWRRSLQAQIMAEMPSVYCDSYGRHWQSAGDVALFAPVLATARRIGSTVNPVYEINMNNPESDWVKESREQGQCAAALLELWRGRGIRICTPARR